MKGIPMRQIMIVLALCVAAQFLCAQSAPEKKLQKQDVPKAVLEAFEKAYPKAEAKGFAKEMEDGKTEFEVESIEGTIHRDIQYAPDGTVLVIEESMAVENLPAAVQDALKKDFAKGTVTTSEKVTKGSVVHYELVVQGKRKTVEVVFDADGKVIKKEIKDSKEKKHKKEKKDEDDEKDEKDEK
jgi:hypothetical protein